MWVRSLGWEDPPEEGMATHSSILAWRMPWTEEPGGLQPMGSQRGDTTEHRRAQTHCHVTSSPTCTLSGGKGSLACCSPWGRREGA